MNSIGAGLFNSHCSIFNFQCWLPDQGSNLDSSDPESDVLPVTPSGKIDFMQILR